MKKSIACVLILLLLGGIVGCTAPDTVAPELLEPVGIQLDTAVVTRGDIYEATVYNGEVVPYVEMLSFTADGRLGEILVQHGDMVQEGQQLAVMDVTQLQGQIETLQEEIAHATKMGEYDDRLAALDIAIAQEQLNILRQDGAAIGICAEKSLKIEQMELNLKQNRELREMELAQKAEHLEKLTKQLSNAVITAPFSGQIVYITSAEAGSNIRAYGSIIGIADESRLRISTEYISEQKIGNLDRIYARIMDQDVPLVYVPLDGKEYISKMLAGEKIESEFMAEMYSEDLQSGQYAAVMLIHVYRENVLTVPINAVHRDEKGRYVYKLDGDLRVRCNVTVGITNEAEVEILEGLQEGDVVYVKE